MRVYGRRGSRNSRLMRGEASKKRSRWAAREGSEANLVLLISEGVILARWIIMRAEISTYLRLRARISSSTWGLEEETDLRVKRIWARAKGRTLVLLVWASYCFMKKDSWTGREKLRVAKTVGMRLMTPGSASVCFLMRWARGWSTIWGSMPQYSAMESVGSRAAERRVLREYWWKERWVTETASGTT